MHSTPVASCLQLWSLGNTMILLPLGRSLATWNRCSKMRWVWVSSLLPTQICSLPSPQLPMRSEVQSLHVDMDARANFEVLHPEKTTILVGVFVNRCVFLKFSKTVESFSIFKRLGGWDKPHDLNQPGFRPGYLFEMWRTFQKFLG